MRILFRSAYKIIFLLLFFSILPILYLIWPFYKIKVALLIYDRIGHLGVNTELFIRRLKSGIYSSDIHYLFISGAPCNRQLLKMYKRVIPIIESNWAVRFYHSAETIFIKTRFHQKLDFCSNEWLEFTNGETSISFTPEEEATGRDNLKKMGISQDDWFVLVHARDSAYLNHKKQDDLHKYDYHNFRDCHFENYIKAADYITSLGGFALKFGSTNSGKLKVNNPKFIDYSYDYRSDFMDIYLAAKCKFFLGNTSGVFLISTIFKKPSAIANFIPLPITPLSNFDLFIPKHLKDKKTGAILGLEEIKKQGLMGFHILYGEYYQERNIEVLENTAEEILELAKDMITFMKVKPSERDPRQFRFKEKYLKDYPHYELAGNIAISFLERHPNYLS